MTAPAPRSDASQPSDRRRHDRVSCQISLTGKAGTRQASVTAVDLSLTGARVVLPADWLGQWITLSGEGLRSDRSSVRAQVVWKQPLESGEIMAGLHFLEDPARLGATWVTQSLRREGMVRRRKHHNAVACDRPVIATHPSHRELPARLVSLSATGAELEEMPYLPIGAMLRLVVPYDEHSKRFLVQAQVVRQARKGRHWRLSLQLLMDDQAGDHMKLQRVLRELKSATD